MRFLRIIPVVGVVGIVPLVWVMMPRADINPVMGSDTGWRPTPAEVAAAVGPGGAGSYQDARHNQFGDLFKKRYRERGFAVGIRFESDNRIKAMFAPMIPRWDMSRVAVEARTEAQGIFKHPFDVDIYETYITSPMKKLAEVRAVPGSDQPQVKFDPRFAQAEEIERAKAIAQRPRFRLRKAMMTGGRPFPFGRPMPFGRMGPPMMGDRPFPLGRMGAPMMPLQ